MDNSVPPNMPSNNVMINRFFMSPDERNRKANGKKIMQDFYQQQTSNSNSLNFFQARNAQWVQDMLWAKGSQNMNEFVDFNKVSDGNQAWVNIDMTPQRLAPKFVGTLVESMAKTITYAEVNAVDEMSMSEKDDRMFEALYRMQDVEVIADMQKEAGMQLEPEGAYVPESELAARIHFELEDKLPKEIKFEKIIENVKDDVKFERIANRKTLYDLVVLNATFLKIEKCGNKKYTIRQCITPNMLYNFFMNDSGEYEISTIGEMYNVKVRDFRRKFGKTPEKPDGLDEKEIFNLAKLSSNKNIGKFNYLWNDTFAYLSYNQTRPYDDCSILVIDAEIDCGEDVYYVSKKDNYGKENISPRSGIPYQSKDKKGNIVEQPKPENTEIIKGRRNSWMRGVYAPYGDKLLYWGEPDIIVSPYTDYYRPLSSYCAIIPNNDGDFVPSLFARAKEPLKEYTAIKLKRKQLIAQLRPSGYRIDVETARNLDLGNGDTIDWLEVVRIYNQTGIELWSSKGVDPLKPEAPPISATTADTAVQKIIELTNTLAGIVQEIRELLGVPQYRDGSDVGDRTSGVLQEQQMSASYNVTDYILNANNQVWEEAFYKICLLHWNDIVKEEPESKDDMLNTRFRVQVKTKSTDYQKQLLEKDIDRYSQVPDAQGNPSLTPKDAFYLREIDNNKLARWYLADTFELNRKRAIQQSIDLQKQNADTQNQSIETKAKADQELQDKALRAKKDEIEFQSTKDKELELLRGFMQVAAKDETGTLIQQFMPAIQQLVPNITIPLQQENQNMVSQIQEAQAQEQAAAEQQAMIEQLPPEQQEALMAQQMQQ